jgi:hypothetical protein
VTQSVCQWSLFAMILWQYLILDEFNIVGWHMSTMPSFAQWFASQLASFSFSLSRLIINHYHNLYYSSLFFNTSSSSYFSLSLRFSSSPYIYSFDHHYYTFFSSSNAHILLLLVRLRIFERSKFAHCYNYFAPDTKPDVVINYFCLSENSVTSIWLRD